MILGEKVRWQGNQKDAEIIELSPYGLVVGLRFADWSERSGIPVSECHSLLGNLHMSKNPVEGDPIAPRGIPSQEGLGHL